MNFDKTVRRLKTYTSSQGYVYQYYFVGKRAALAGDPEAPATEFVFDVTSDRKLTYAVSVFLPEKSGSAWAAAHGRELTEAEQYAAAKLRLFRAFDELEDVMRQGRRLSVDGQLLEESLRELGIS
ncbi:MAG: hypothetical protein WBX38_02785 [Candidatus Sulfotelmatobacter sp.]